MNISGINTCRRKRVIPTRNLAADGFTLTEALVVLALLSAILLIATPQLLSMLQTYYAKTAAAQLAIQLRFARNECVTRKIPYRVIIKSQSAPSDANTYVVQYDPSLTNSFQTVPDIDFHIPRGVVFLDSPVFSGGQAMITFTTHGRATAVTGSPPYDVKVQAPNGITFRILIQNTGIVNWEKA